MKKGISIPISTLVILAIAIVVMLAIIAWFMGAFTPSGRQLSAQQKFNMACRTWSISNCAGNPPRGVCEAYRNMTGSFIDCSDTSSLSESTKEAIARACGCTPPFGTGFGTGESLKAIGEACTANSECSSGFCNSTTHTCDTKPGP